MQTVPQLDNEIVTFVGPRTITLKRESLSGSLASNEVLIRCRTSLISSGTELGLFTGSHGGFQNQDETDRDVPTFSYPLIPGYAAVGEIIGVGSSVEGLFPGTLVYYPGHHQRYQIVDPSVVPVIPVPDGMDPNHAPYARFGQISGTAPAFSDAGAGDCVVVIGQGLIGNIAAQLFRIRGAKVCGVDLMASRRDIAGKVGIDATIDPTSQDTERSAAEWAGDDGIHTVVEATGNPRLIELALRMARERGEVILLGSPLTATAADDGLPARIPHMIHRKGLRVIGAHEALVPRIDAPDGGLTQLHLARTALEHIQAGRLRVDVLISDKVLPERIADAYTALLDRKDEVMTVLVDWGN